MEQNSAAAGHVLLFVMSGCPYCRQTLGWMEELFSRHPEYRSIPLRIVDETRERDLASRYDYYYVPTFYVGAEKVHEGACSAAVVESVFARAWAECSERGGKP